MADIDRQTDWGKGGGGKRDGRSCIHPFQFCGLKPTHTTFTLGSFMYVHSDLELREFSSGSSSILTAFVIILVFSNAAF